MFFTNVTIHIQFHIRDSQISNKIKFEKNDQNSNFQFIFTQYWPTEVLLVAPTKMRTMMTKIQLLQW